MLNSIHAHLGEPLMPHDLWAAWSFDPIVTVALAMAGILYWRGARRRGRPHPGRSALFAAGLATIGVAVLSPVDALADVLVSGHMVQHLLLIMVAAPLIVLGDPGTMMGGVPRDLRKPFGRWRHRNGLTPARVGILRNPVLIFLATTGAIWLWHASVAYEAAAADSWLHALEHLTFLVTGILFWNVLLSRHPSSRLAPGAGVFLIFAVAMQGVILSALLTFGDTPWYPSYEASARSWGVEPIDDQRLAGLIMWIPGGLVYTGVALASMKRWLQRDPALERAERRLEPG